MTDLSLALALLLASGLVAASAAGYAIAFAVYRRVWRWRTDREIRRRLRGIGG